MKKAHLQRSVGEGLDGPLRGLPQDRLRRQSRRSNSANSGAASHLDLLISLPAFSEAG
jgi:hypothetical protein